MIKDYGLLGTFSFPPPYISASIATIHMISSNSITFDDPWILPSDSELDSFGGMTPLSPFEIPYQVVQSFSDAYSTETDPMNVIHGESISISNSASSTLFDPIHSDEQIHELLSIDHLPWEDLHHRSSLLLELGHFENDFSFIFTIDYVKEPQNPLQHSDSKLNLENISRTVPIDILVKLGIIENIHIDSCCMDDEIQTYKALFQEFCKVFAWSYEEMLGIDMSIVFHEIKTYLGAKPV